VLSDSDQDDVPDASWYGPSSTLTSTRLTPAPEEATPVTVTVFETLAPAEGKVKPTLGTVDAFFTTIGSSAQA